MNNSGSKPLLASHYIVTGGRLVRPIPAVRTTAPLIDSAPFTVQIVNLVVIRSHNIHISFWRRLQFLPSSHRIRSSANKVLCAQNVFIETSKC